MPNYKRIIPRTPIVEAVGGIARIYANEDGDLVVEYTSGNIEIVPIDTTGYIILDGEFAPNTQVNDHNGGDASAPGVIVINAGGA
jgi:hypothetical protein